MPASIILDFMGILLDRGNGGTCFSVIVTLKDTGERYMLRFINGALLQFENTLKRDTDLLLTTSKNTLHYILTSDMEKSL